MAIAHLMAGFTLAQGDMLRRAMGKKKKEIMDEYREKFMAGCLANGHPEKLAGGLYDLLEEFAGYGFNKAHTAPYGLLAYQTAYLKYHYPVQFMAAFLSSIIGDTEKIARYVDECRRMGVPVLPPDINASYANYSVEHDKVRIGLAAIKNVGVGAIDSLVAERSAGGPFKSIGDLCRRVDTRQLNKRAFESLIKAGAMDSFGATRSQLLAVLDQSMERTAAAQRKKVNGQVSLFDLATTIPDAALAEDDVPLPEMTEFPTSMLLTMEKELLGIYVSGHPLGQYERAIRERASTQAAALGELADGDKVILGGLVVQSRKITTKGGDPMAFLTLEDMTGQVEVVIFPRVFAKFARVLDGQANVLLVTGRLQLREDTPKIIAEEISTLAEQSKPKVYLKVGSSDQRLLQQLRATLQLCHGKSPVYLCFSNPKKTLLTHDEFWVEPGGEMVAMIEHVLGKGAVSIVGP